MTDWNDWLRRYDKPQSPHSLRLRTVRRLVHRRLDRLAPAQLAVLSICAGDGRDVIEVLAERDDASRVRATLVELDPRLCALARERAAEAGLAGLDVRPADAGITDTYAGLSPHDLVILVGVFGNISDADVRTSVETLPALCKPGALVVWSLRRNKAADGTGPGQKSPSSGRTWRNDHDRIARVGAWFEQAGFATVFANRPDASFHVGAQRFDGATTSLVPGKRFFTFDLSQDEIPLVP